MLFRHFCVMEDLVIPASLVLAAILYSFVIIGLIVGLMRNPPSRSAHKPLVSIIVAARNEEENLQRLLPALVAQTYPDFEIIIVNDRSADKSSAVVASFQQKHKNLKLIEVSARPADIPPKKYALAQGIKASEGEILCFTDADCVPGREWVGELVALFRPEIGMVVGYSPYDDLLQTGIPKAGFGKELFWKFIAYEELKAAAWSAGSISWRKGWLCTGRNLAYRRAVYDEVGGYEKIKESVSGDDDLFLQLVRRETAWKIRYSFSRESFVKTIPPPTFSAFLEQRKRHFSAAKFFPLSMKLFFFFFHLSNLALFIGFLGFLANFSPLLIGLPCFAAKLIADASLFFTLSETFRQRGFAAYFLLMEILYIFYNTLIGPLGFIRKFEWKPEPKE
jgi:cellulose synthase/poly-beta-1,6-N-acetylglucosamine synthase-like glycosyltransferase